MKLVNAKYGISIEFKENEINSLIVENTEAFSDLVSELYDQSQGKEGNFILQKNCKEIKFAKFVDCIMEPFSLSINNKRYLTQLYEEMGVYCNETKYEQKSKIVEMLVNLIDEISVASAYDIVFDLDISPETLFKASNVLFNEEFESLKEKMVQYISIVSSLNTVSLIVLVHFKCFFRQEELQEICEAAMCHKIPILFVENNAEKILECEKCCIIDKDLCIIEM